MAGMHQLRMLVVDVGVRGGSGWLVPSPRERTTAREGAICPSPAPGAGLPSVRHPHRGDLRPPLRPTSRHLAPPLSADVICNPRIGRIPPRPAAPGGSSSPGAGAAVVRVCRASPVSRAALLVGEVNCRVGRVLGRVRCVLGACPGCARVPACGRAPRPWARLRKRRAWVAHTPLTSPLCSPTRTSPDVTSRSPVPVLQQPPDRPRPACIGLGRPRRPTSFAHSRTPPSLHPRDRIGFRPPPSRRCNSPHLRSDSVRRASPASSPGRARPSAPPAWIGAGTRRSHDTF